MPSIQLNRRLWSNYDWSQSGEEWSANWGGTDVVWHGTLMPRIGRFLGAVRVVELGPGYGRLTAHLKDYCSSLVLVDISPNCIEFCRGRFDDETHLEYVVNDGSSLAFLPDRSIDFVFSFDSLVHADLSAITAYLAEIARVLKIGGKAVLHHSNLAAVAPAHSGGDHLRARDVSAALIRDATDNLPNLTCSLQEIISWDETVRLIDCISTFVCGAAATTTRVIDFPDFYQRARELREISERYR